MKNIYIERQQLGGRETVAQFGWQQIRRNIAERFEYLTDQGEFMPQALRRLTFTSEERQNAAMDVFGMWTSLESMRFNQAVGKDAIFARLSKARLTQEPVTLFVPWGVKPQGKIGLERQVLDRLQNLQSQLSARGIPSRILIMPADVYATEVNGIDEKLTERYFRKIQQEAESRGMIVKSWSEIRSENRERYEDIAKTLTDAKLETIVGNAGSMERVFKAATRRSEGTDTRKAAFDYLRQRVAEGIMVDELYKPIKVSLAPKNKDNKIDGPLPRVYLFPSDLQLPWLK